ncbi:MAG TPA: fluoride efflux transporter CrcB [Hyphomicrobiales bacterium]|nr:fluoride efflux transporter CrcB [Hyphomicrobiales bacterium]
MKFALLAAAGGAIGAAARYIVNVLTLHVFGPGFPWGTFAVNIAGSFVMGVFIALGALRLNLSSEIRVLVATGIFGGFTTFSSFSLDFVTLFERKDYGIAAIYLAGSVGLSILALFAGLIIVRQWLS